MKLTKDQLKEQIVAGIFENYSGKVTASVLQQILLNMVDSFSGDMGVASFDITDFSVSPTKVQVGTGINVTCKVKNIGAAMGSTVVKIELQKPSIILYTKELIRPTIPILPTVIWSKTINVDNLPSGSFASINETIPTTQVGIYNYNVVVKADTASQNQPVQVISDKEFVISGQVVKSQTLIPKTPTIPGSVIKPVGIRDSVLADTQLMTSKLDLVSDSLNIGSLTRFVSQPLEGVKVYLKGNPALSAITDSEGNYTLKSTTPITGTLVFSLVGYIQQEVAITDQTEIDITMKPLRFLDLNDNFNYNFGRLNDLKDKLGTIIEKDPALATNLTNTKGFIDGINSKYNVKKEDLVKGTLNNTIVDDFKAVYTPIFDAAKQIKDEINKNGSTPELESKLNANMELINAGTSSLLSTIASTDADLTTSSSAYKYLSTEFTSSISAVSTAGASSIMSNIETIAGGAAKTNLSKALSGLIK
jgi:hypothetical protein